MSDLALKLFLEKKFQKPYTREKVISLLTSGVLFLARIKTLPNEEKKPLLMLTVKEIITQSDLPDYAKETLCELVDTIGDSVIEGLVTLGKDMVSFVKKQKCCFK